MSTVVSPATAPAPARSTSVRFVPLAIGWAAVIAVVTAVLATRDPSTVSSMVLGNVSVAVALLFSAGACFRAARLRTAASRGWAWMAVAELMGGLGQLIFTFAVLDGSSTQSSRCPTPSATSDTPCPSWWRCSSSRGPPNG